MDISTLAVAKQFALKVAAGFSSVTVDEPNCAIIFTLNDSQIATLHIPQPQDGVSVSDIAIETRTTEDGASVRMVVFTLSDGTEIEGGIFPEPTLANDLIATQSIGSVVAGKKYPKGTSLETIIRDILIKVENPNVSIKLTPATTLYDIVSDSISNITLTAVATKKTYDIAAIKFYVNGQLVSTKNDSSVKSGGNIVYEYTPDTPIKNTTVFKVEAIDEKGGNNSSSMTTTFVGKSYYGIVGSEIGDPTAVQIKSLSNTLKNTKSYVYKNIVCDYNKIVYAYPSSFGALSSIKDVVNNFNYTSSFTRTTVTIDNIEYYCYTLTEPTGADGVDLTFA